MKILYPIQHLEMVLFLKFWDNLVYLFFNEFINESKLDSILLIIDEDEVWSNISLGWFIIFNFLSI